MKQTIFVFAFLLILASINVGIQPSEAQTVETITLPPNSTPMGLTYDRNRNVTWIALYWNESIAKVDVNTKNYTLYPLPDVDQFYRGPMPWLTVLDGERNLWIKIRGYKSTPSQPTGTISAVFKFNVEKETFTILPFFSFGGEDLKFHKGYIWLAGMNLLKINPVTETIEAQYPIGYEERFPDGYVQYLPMYIAPDGDILWITLLNHPHHYLKNGFGGKLARFNITSETWSYVVTDLDRPLGIESDANYVYIAENTINPEVEEPQPPGTPIPMGTIAIVNKRDLSVTRIQTTYVTNTGPYLLLKDSYGNLWWTDGSLHYGMKSPNGESYIYAGGQYSYFMAEVKDSIWRTSSGSAYVAITSTSKSSDINKDGKVDIKDIAIVAKAFGSYVDSENWNSIADLDNNNKIDIRDVAKVATDYGKSWG